MMIWTPYQIATAGMIGTDQVVTSPSSQADRTAVLNFLSRSDVTNQLHLLGIDPSNAKDRVAAMTDQEVQQLAGRINALPAGADTSWGAVLLVILIVAAVWWFWQR